MAATWKDLASESRTISDSDFKAYWRKRFLAPIQSLQGKWAMPMFVSLFLDFERDGDWNTLRDILSSTLENLDGKAEPPKLYTGAAGLLGNPVQSARKTRPPEFWTHAEPPRLFAQQLFLMAVIVGVVAIVVAVSWFIGK